MRGKTNPGDGADRTEMTGQIRMEWFGQIRLEF